jgi:hypothetical protein
MRLLPILCAAFLALLGSATPPHMLRIDSAGLEEMEPGCAGAAPGRCTALADGSGALVAAATPEDLLASDFVPGAAPPPLVPMLTLALNPPLISPVRVVISLPQQKAYVFDRGALFATSAVSTGRPGHETPVGTFRILEKQVRHRSNLYSDAPMPFMERLTMSGIALHAGHLPGYPASHGCIRFPWAFARKLFAITDMATRVTITRARPQTPEDALDVG